MFSAGKNIVSANDSLVKVSPEYLYKSIRSPKPEISSKIRQLRIIRSLDPKRYTICKRELPYIVCATFNPPIRKTEYFVSTEYFIIDIDHISDSDTTVSDLRRMLQNDTRVYMLFLSPGEDGLKVIFRLKEKIFDSGIYSVFYKSFADEFANQYHLEKILDKKTSDVCRACFISEDEQAYFNPDAEPVNIERYVNSYDCLSAMDVIEEIRKKNSTPQPETIHTKPDEDAFAKIRDILKLRKVPCAKDAAFYVPEQLNDITEELKAFLESTGIVVKEIRNISYGKKF
ncbi:MAG: CRISPR-associated primase-polymerase type B, partial [Candidatus Cryptobacteroides sp.]